MKRLITCALSGLLLTQLALPSLATSTAPETKATTAAQPKSSDVIPAAVQVTDVQYLAPNGTYNANLQVTSPVNVDGLALPVGSIIQGQFRPISGGLQFVANSVIANGNRYSLNAASDLLNDFKDPRETDGGNILEDALIGAAGGALIGGPLGALVIGAASGAAAGAVIGNVTAQQVVEIRPGQPINLFVR